MTRADRHRPPLGTGYAAIVFAAAVACAPTAAPPVTTDPVEIAIADPPDEPEPDPEPAPPPADDCPIALPPWEGEPIAEVEISEDDPLQGVFPLERALARLGGPKHGALAAIIETELGNLTCELWPHRAPITVANFVGLARGLRPFRHEGAWHERPGYDGTIFHRRIPAFMIQGGDPTGTGKGGPGYQIPDEQWAGAKHDRAGLLSMANRGPNTGGMQFFITDGAAPHLPPSFTIFGECDPLDVITTIAKADQNPAMTVRIERDPRRQAPPGICN